MASTVPPSPSDGGRSSLSPLPSPSLPLHAPPLALPKKKLVLAPPFGAWDSPGAGSDWDTAGVGSGASTTEVEGGDSGGADPRSVSREPGRYSAAFDSLREEHSGGLGQAGGVHPGHTRGPHAGRGSWSWFSDEDKARDTLPSPPGSKKNNEIRESPEFTNPELKSPEFKCPELKSPEFKCPEFKSPEFKWAQNPSRGGGTEAGGAWDSWDEEESPQGAGGGSFDGSFPDRLEDIMEHPSSSYSSGSEAPGATQNPIVPLVPGRTAVASLSKTEDATGGGLGCSGSGLLVGGRGGARAEEAPWFVHSRAFKAQEVQGPLFSYSSSPSPEAAHASGKGNQSKGDTKEEAPGDATNSPAVQAVYPGHTSVPGPASAPTPEALARPRPLASFPRLLKPSRLHTELGPPANSPFSSSHPVSSPPTASPPMPSLSSSSPRPLSPPTSLPTGNAPGCTPLHSQEPHPGHTSVPATVCPGSASGPLGPPQPWFRTLFQAGRTQSCEGGAFSMRGAPAVHHLGPQAPLALQAPAHPGLLRGTPRMKGRTRSCEAGVLPEGLAPAEHRSGPLGPQAIPALQVHWGHSRSLQGIKVYARGAYSAEAPAGGGCERCAGGRPGWSWGNKGREMGRQRWGGRVSREVERVGLAEEGSKGDLMAQGSADTGLDRFKFEPLVLNWDGDTLAGSILNGDILGDSLFSRGSPAPGDPSLPPLFSPLDASPRSSFSSNSGSPRSPERDSGAHDDVTPARAPLGRLGLTTSPQTEDLTALLKGQRQGATGTAEESMSIREGTLGSGSKCGEAASSPAHARAGAPGADTWQRSESCSARPGQAGFKRRPVLAPKFGAWEEVPKAEGTHGASMAPAGGGAGSPGKGDVTVTSWESRDAEGAFSYSNVFLRLREYHNGTEGVPRPRTEGTPLRTGATGVDCAGEISAVVVATQAAQGNAGRPQRKRLWRIWGRSVSAGVVEGCAVGPQADKGAPESGSRNVQEIVPTAGPEKGLVNASEGGPQRGYWSGWFARALARRGERRSLD